MKNDKGEVKDKQEKKESALQTVTEGFSQKSQRISKSLRRFLKQTATPDWSMSVWTV